MGSDYQAGLTCRFDVQCGRGTLEKPCFSKEQCKCRDILTRVLCFVWKWYLIFCNRAQQSGREWKNEEEEQRGQSDQKKGTGQHHTVLDKQMDSLIYDVLLFYLSVCVCVCVHTCM